MTTKFTDAFVNDCYQFILQGNTLTAAGAKFGANPDNISKAIRARGLAIPKTKRVAPNKKHIPFKVVKSLIDADFSVKAIAEKFNVSRCVVVRILNENGIQQPNRSEGMYTRMRNTSALERKKLTESAHNAVRGKRQTLDHRIKVANTRSVVRYDHLIGRGEKELKKLLEERGIKPYWQAPIEAYNVDFLINGCVAVELTTESSSRFTRNAQQIHRFKKLAEHNIRVLGISFDAVESLAGNLDQIIADINILSSDKTPIRQHRVVRCRLENTAIVRNDLGQFASVSIPEKFVYTRKYIDW